MQRTVHTPDGRELAVEEAGDPAGRQVLVHGGTPNSRRLYGPHTGDAAERGLRLISHDRPGYGGSSPQRRLTDDDGHLTLFQYRVPEVHAWLSEHL